MTAADLEYVEALYKQQIKSLPAEARLRLLALMARIWHNHPFRKRQSYLPLLNALRASTIKVEHCSKQPVK